LRKSEDDFLNFIDLDNLNDIMESIKYCASFTKLLVIMVSYDEPVGYYKKSSTVRFFSDYLRKVIINLFFLYF